MTQTGRHPLCRKASLHYTLLLLASWLAHPFSLCPIALQRFEFSHQQMGTTFRIIMYTQEGDVAKKAAVAAFKRVDELNQIFSDYDPQSELRQIPDSRKKKIKVSREMRYLLKRAQKISRKSQGAFDISIGPLTKLWRRAFRQQQFPSQEAIEAAREKVDYRHIHFSLFGKVWLGMEDMRLDAGGIAKGYALDEAMKILHGRDIRSALVDGGGDLLLGDPPPGKTGWSVEVITLNDRGEREQRKLYLSNVAIASSGDTYRYLEWEGKRYSHIIDPRTGLGVSHEALVTVMAPSGWLADAYWLLP